MKRTLLVFLATTLGLTIYAQVPEHQLTVLVDGSTTPEKIPDDLAFHHFMLAVAEHQSPTKEESARRESRLVPIGLSAQDHDLFIAALSGLKEQLDAIQTAREAASADTSSARDTALSSLTAKEVLAVSTVRAALQNMSLDGQSRLNLYIKTHVKRCIRILN